MVFSSNIFLFGFLPLFLAVYYLCPVRWRSVPILGGSYLFYGWWRIDFVFLFAGVTAWNYLIYRRMRHADAKGAAAAPVGSMWLKIGVAGNLLTLGLFKYFNFGVDSLNAALSQSGLHSIEALQFILPIGISFYIFQAISFLIDVYRKDAPEPRSFWDFAAFISLFPQLIAGPILRYKDVASQFQSRTHDMDHFSEGAYRFMIGFAKKVLIADSVAPLADAAFALENPSFSEAWLGALAYTVQLYFDFSGYSDMAIGLGLMMGFRFIENFRHPYISRSITEFWRRWHISLSSWLKDYLYIPLGGNRKGRVRTYINLSVTMVLGGLWHGANWTFVLWGAWHGLLLAVERACGVRAALPGAAGADSADNGRRRSALMIVPTMLCVIVGWVMFRAEAPAQAWSFYKGMLGLNGFGLTGALAWQVQYMALAFLALGWILIYFHAYILDFRREKVGTPFMRALGYQKPVAAAAAIIVFLLAVSRLAAQSYSPFLYFQF